MNLKQLEDRERFEKWQCAYPKLLVTSQLDAASLSVTLPVATTTSVAARFEGGRSNRAVRAPDCSNGSPYLSHPGA